MPHERDREVICRAHGLRYDPSLAAGCERCLTGAQPAGSSGSAGLLKRVAAALAVVVIGTFFLHDSESPDPATESAAGHPVMEPHPYRPMIEQIESVLYAEHSAGPADAEHVRHWAEQLAVRMKEWESRLYMTPHITRVGEFARWVDDRAASGFGDAELRAARDRWEAVRAHIFEPAAWFKTSAR